MSRPLIPMSQRFVRSTHLSTGGEMLGVLAVDAADDSPILLEREVLKCTLCWVGISHSTALHAAETAVDAR